MAAAARRLSAFVLDGRHDLIGEGDDGGVRFRKELLRVGSWVHPVTRRRVDVDLGRLRRLAENTNRFIRAGNPVPFPDGHTLDARRNLGELEALEVDGESLYGTIVVRDRDVIEGDKVGTTIRHVSVCVERDVVEPSTGDVLDEVVTHVAATPVPVVGGQANFVRLSRDGEEVTVTAFVADEEDEGMLALSRALGLDEAADEAVLLERVLKLKDKAQKAEAEAEAAREKAEVLARKVEALEKNIEERRKADVESYVDGLKRASADAGSPIPEEKLARVRHWFDQGLDEAARELGDALLELAKTHGFVDGVKDTENPAAKDPDVERRRQEAYAKAQILEAAGCEVTMSRDGTAIEKVTMNGKEVRI